MFFHPSVIENVFTYDFNLCFLKNHGLLHNQRKVFSNLGSMNISDFFGKTELKLRGKSPSDKIFNFRNPECNPFIGQITNQRATVNTQKSKTVTNLSRNTQAVTRLVKSILFNFIYFLLLQ